MFPALLLAAVLHRPELLVCAVAAEAERRGLDPIVVCALVECESEWRIHARSGSGDRGLFQINPRWHGPFRTQVASHIQQGCGILRTELDRSSGKMDQALSRYNTGTVGRVGARYAAKVLAVAARIRSAVEKKVSTPWRGACTMGRMDRVYGFTYEWAPRREET